MSKFPSVEMKVQKEPAWTHVFSCYRVSICMGQTEVLKSTPISGATDVYFYKLEKEQTNAYGKEEWVKY